MGLLSSLFSGKRGGNRYARDFSGIARPAERKERSSKGGLFGRGARNERNERNERSNHALRPEKKERPVRPERERSGLSGAVRTGRASQAARETETAWISVDAEPSSGGRLKTLCLWTLGLGLGCAALFGLAVGGLQLHRIATTSDFFAIHKIEIRGAAHFKREAVLAAAGLKEGMNSLTVNISDVEQGVRDNPWVAEVAVKRRLPDAFEIRIRERAPAFWMRKDDTLYYADNKGAVIAPVDVGNFLSLPTLEIMSGGEVLLPQIDELARAFQAARLPVDMAGVSLFRVSAAKGFEVFIENRNLVLCIAAEDWDMNLRRLGEVLTDLARRGELKAAREVWAADGNVWVVADV